MRVSVIIPNINGAHFLRVCLQSVLAQDVDAHTLEVIVVDNGSTDDSRAMLQREFPQVRCIVNEQNAGFTRAINQGAAAANGDLLLLLNNDTIVQPHAILRLINALEQAGTSVAAVQPLLLNAENPARLDSAGIALDRRLRARDDGHGLPVTATNSSTREIWGACAACMLVRRAVFERAGGFDPDYFAEWDDVDFSLRVRWLGFRFMLVPAAIVHHHRSPTSNRDNPAKILRHRRNQVLTMIKSLPQGMRACRIAYRLLHDLSMIPHYLKQHELRGMLRVWRECVELHHALRTRRAALLREAVLTHGQMRRQLRTFMHTRSGL